MDEVIRRFNDNSIKYLVIGGQAIRLMGMPRFSMDWDVFIPGRDLNNIQRINNILSDILDEELEPLGDKRQNFIQTFQTQFGTLQFHLAPVALPPFHEAERNSMTFTSENGTPVRCVSEKDLYLCKLKVNRPKDFDDILFLKNLCGNINNHFEPGNAHT